MGLAIVVVFVTTYMLILPAITLEQDKADEIGAKTETVQEASVEEEEVAEEAVEEEKDAEEPEAEETPPEEIKEEKATDSESESKKEASSDKPKAEEKKPEQKQNSSGSIAAEGESLTATLSYTEKAGIPENATLDVKEIEEDSKDYDKYVKQAAEAVGEAESKSTTPAVTSSHVFRLKSRTKTGIPSSRTHR